MCGIFGEVSSTSISNRNLRLLSNHARRRGVDSSGIVYFDKEYNVLRANYDIQALLKEANFNNSSFVMGHSRLVTNGLNDNQPVIRDGIIVLHNGIITNEEEIWYQSSQSRMHTIDSEAINVVVLDYLNANGDEIDEKIFNHLNDHLKGTLSTAIAIPRLGKLVLFSNNGSLYVCKTDTSTYFSSESYPLEKLMNLEANQLMSQGLILDIPISSSIFINKDSPIRDEDLIPSFRFNNEEENLLEFRHHDLRRCTKCILPQTMPFIEFDEHGVCNYCNGYNTRNTAKSKEELRDLIKHYVGKHKYDCIVPFSGGRDSCYSLHIIVKELGLKPLTFTYDWGMVTDLARRNISRMCQQLGVENIVVAANISKKRTNIRKNLKAWLRHPDLGMVSILTAGDKHFFRYNEIVKRENNVALELWGTNPLEITHFKAGFLGIKPDLLSKTVYYSGLHKQLDYHSKRFKAMLKSLGYFNLSLWDTLSGEYYRSIKKKSDYYHIYDFMRWDEYEVNSTLEKYGFEKAPDTKSTWRIGDGTAAFYNYIYYTIAGFTEHDTFRSNQIREGQLTRSEALELVLDENRPRYQNIRWYLDAVGLDFKDTIKIINNAKKLY
jgi:glutamine---fructose-6-phosphate transaminase (isomerizing)